MELRTDQRTLILE